MKFITHRSKLLCLSLCSLLSAGILSADARDDKIAELQRKIEQLQKDLQELAQQTNENVDDLNERVDANELSATLNKVKMGLEFSTGVVNSNVDFSDTDNGYKGSNNNKWATEVHLNLNAQINDRTKFTGRMSMAKYWGDMGLTGLGKDMDAGRNPDGGSLVYLDRAYVDFHVLDDLVVTAGRLPGTDGPGSNLRNNSVRMATYPALFVNALGDAGVITYSPSFLKESETALRVGYSKIYQWVEGNGQGRTFYGNQDDTDSNLYFAVAETKLPLGPVGDNTLLVSYAYASDYSMPITSGTTNLGVQNLGDSQIVNVHFENNKFFGTPLSWFVSGGYYKGTQSNIDKILRNQSGNPDISLELLEQAAASGQTLSAAQQALLGLGTRLNYNEKDAWAVHVGLRYDILDSLKVGYEYFHGSQYWYTFTRPSINDPFNFRSTRGDSHDVYAIYQMDMYQYLRLSYTYINYKYSNSGLPFGGASKISDTAEAFMLLYNLRF